MKQTDKAAALALTPVSRETEARLDRYVVLLQQWQAKTNLIAPSTLQHIWTRHVADSLQLLLIKPTARVWADLGSGGGFPGIVLACAMADVNGGVVHLVERNAKKAAFLREAVRVTGAAGLVHLNDIEDYVDNSAAGIECFSARAVAPLNKLLDVTQPLIAKGATALFHKGQDVEVELTEATKYWILQWRFHPSVTGPGSIIEITEAAPWQNAAAQ